MVDKLKIVANPLISKTRLEDKEEKKLKNKYLVKNTNYTVDI